MLAITDQTSSIHGGTIVLIIKCEIACNQTDMPVNCNKLFIGAYYRSHKHDQSSIDELILSLCQI